MHVVLIPGDGIGPEVTRAAQDVIAAAGVALDWVMAPAGLTAAEELGDPLPEKTLDLIRKYRVALKGPCTTPVGKGYRSINVRLRQGLDLYASVRPVRTLPGVKLWARLKQIAAMELDREELLMKLGAARAKARAAWRLLDVEVAADAATFTYTLNRGKLRQARRHEGRYLLRTNMCGEQPADLWQFYIQLVEVEAVFKNLKDDLRLRPIYHQLEGRIEAHIFVAFLAYCLHVTLRARLTPLAPGLTPRAVLDKFAAIQMLDVHLPTTDGRTLILSRYTELTADQKLLAKNLKLDLPPQPPPRITASGHLARPATTPLM